MTRDLQHILQQLVGKSCWATVANRATGTAVGIDLGEKINRKKPLGNTKLSSDVRNFTAEYSLFLEDCVWRIESSSKVFCSSESNNIDGGTMLSGLKRLHGRVIQSYKLSTPSMDLKIDFDEDIILKIFCLHKTLAPLDNYTVFRGEYSVTVNSAGQIMIENS